MYYNYYIKINFRYNTEDKMKESSDKNEKRERTV